MEDDLRRIIKGLDEQGRWVSISTGERLTGQSNFPAGTAYLSSAVFSENLTRLSTYAAQSKPN